MFRLISRIQISMALTMLLFAAAIPIRADVPPRTAGGQALEVPEAQLEQGEIYHVTPGMGTQFVWHSDAPLMRVMAVCNRV
ncbi:MAG: hypothetical protein ABIG44_11355, partial [Planctomycetota bacterium]